MNGYEKQIKEKLKENGWTFLRNGTGSHEIWSNGKHHVSVNYACKSRHTANQIMKDAGIKHRF